MSKSDIIRKLTSRKLWVAVTDFVGMLIVAFGYSQSEATQVAAIIMAGAGVLAYILAEGLSDAAGVNAGYIEADTIQPIEEVEDAE